MNVKIFCQMYGVNQNDSAWIMHKHKHFDGDAREWFDLVGASLTSIPQTLLEDIEVEPVITISEVEAKPKSKKVISDVNETAQENNK